MDGLATALDEITLVLFTTLAPAGALAYALMALPLIVRGGTMEESLRRRLDMFLSVPVVVAMVGLVASATHLGNPANALYVLAGFGRSPLSNEVVCGVVFLGAAGVFWLTSFSEGAQRVAVRRAAAAVVSVLGLAFIGAISLAYNASTIIAWNTPLAAASVWLNALAGGPLLAILGFRMARFYTAGHRLGLAYAVLSAVAVAVGTIVYLLWASTLPSMQNALTSAAELAPAFRPAAIIFAVLGAIGVAFGLRTVAWKGEAPIWLPLVSVAVVLAGIFIMRFMFYMTHMTVGLGV